MYKTKNIINTIQKKNIYIYIQYINLEIYEACYVIEIRVFPL